MTTTWLDCMAVEAADFAELEAEAEAYYQRQEAYQEGMAAAHDMDTLAAVPGDCLNPDAWIDGFCDALEMTNSELMEVGR